MSMVSDEPKRHLSVDDKHRKRLCVIPEFMSTKANIRDGMSIYTYIIARNVPELHAKRLHDATF